MSYLELQVDEHDSDDARVTAARMVALAVNSRDVDVVVKLTSGCEYRQTLEDAQDIGDGQ